MGGGCNVGMGNLPDVYAQSLRATGPRAYISGKSRMHMLQLLCIIISIATTLLVRIPQVIVTHVCEVINTNC